MNLYVYACGDKRFPRSLSGEFREGTCSDRARAERNLKMKKLISIILTAAMALAMTGSALAVQAGAQRIALGADLSAAEREQVLDDFGLDEMSVSDLILTVTNADERKYLEGIVSDSVLGTRALSSVYIITRAEGDGLDITLHNITWITEEVYRNALITAGITDARVTISAPSYGVSGTAALTGIYRAYEDITGEPLSEAAKEVAAEELITTGELADALGSEEAAALVNELKLAIDQMKNMSDDEVRAEIKRIAANLNVTVTEGQVEQLLRLCRSLESVDLDALRGALQSVASTLGTLDSAGAVATGAIGTILNFFSNVGKAIGEFFSNLFG